MNGNGNKNGIESGGSGRENSGVPKCSTKGHRVNTDTKRDKVQRSIGRSVVEVVKKSNGELLFRYIS